ncbi:hypothetical protein ACVRW7_07545 [Streptococcus ratti]|uniref:Uncharacterized protein n=1 Tax=Streptococcus ratti FA-1 = DSM 20564 TaxID=699248 RepID=A0ABP2R0X0_STRRT|nr:hypothetical protein [Streptococcus ratti]EJN94878.1 hypothetical protein SRA_00802 [Streptococcus ratti FA-1 = DSM 20564]EMP70269.1 hypothetical protein D822_04965 [Streptococcus ratti FA-1 = DSM 20564]QEY07026.1 hypothetical protein FY406_04855 [Streptococcus ratti]
MMVNQVQAFIANSSFPKTLEELLQIDELNIELILSGEEFEWTVPRWSKAGDIIFFMYSKTSINTIRRLRKQLNEVKDADVFGVEEVTKLFLLLDKGEYYYSKFGASIFALGQVRGRLFRDDFSYINSFHWGSNIYSGIDNVKVLRNPIAIDDFREFIHISRQSGITPVLGMEFSELKNLICRKNQGLSTLLSVEASPFPMKSINQENWLEMGNMYRRQFFLEYQFRVFYVDYLLKELSDIKTIYKECACYKSSENVKFVDNVIKIAGLYLPVEVKLNIALEKELLG